MKERLQEQKSDNESEKADDEDKSYKNDTKPINNNIKSGSDSNSNQQTTRPKIWSVMDVLGNKENNTSSSKTPTQNSPPASICSRQTNGPAFLNAHQASPNFRPGQYPVGFNAYPFSFSHTTLSYPYTLSASSAAKSELNMSHVAAIRASEQAFKEGLVEKAARMQTGLFSPARELDGMRVRSKIVL